MRPRTYDYLKSVGIEPWLMGFNPLGELIDIVTEALLEDEQPAHMYIYYEQLGQKYAANPERMERNIRHCISIGWRTIWHGRCHEKSTCSTACTAIFCLSECGIFDGFGGITDENWH